MAFAMTFGMFTIEASAEKGDERYQTTASEIAKENNTEVVKTIWWKAKTKAKILTTNEETGAEIRLEKGTKVTVIQRDYHSKAGISQCMLSDGSQCYIANSYLYFMKALATGSRGDYLEASKLAYVNKQKIESDTDTLVWISLDKQRINVFKGSAGNWQLIKVIPCSSGDVNAPTLDQTFRPVYVVQKKSLKVKNLQYYTFFYGSGIHKWPGGGMKRAVGKKPTSHSCVRVSKPKAVWVFNDENVPIGSRVWIW